MGRGSGRDGCKGARCSSPGICAPKGRAAPPTAGPSPRMGAARRRAHRGGSSSHPDPEPPLDQAGSPCLQTDRHPARLPGGRCQPSFSHLFHPLRRHADRRCRVRAAVSGLDPRVEATPRSSPGTRHSTAQHSVGRDILVGRHERKLPWNRTSSLVCRTDESAVADRPDRPSILLFSYRGHSPFRRARLERDPPFAKPAGHRASGMDRSLRGHVRRCEFSGPGGRSSSRLFRFAHPERALYPSLHGPPPNVCGRRPFRW